MTTLSDHLDKKNLEIGKLYKIYTTNNFNRIMPLEFVRLWSRAPRDNGDCITINGGSLVMFLGYLKALNGTDLYMVLYKNHLKIASSVFVKLLSIT